MSDMVRYEINYGCKGIELYFKFRPNQSVLEELKLTKWRWHSRKLCWYTYDSIAHRNQAMNICNNYGVSSKTDINYSITYKKDIMEWELESVLKKNGYSVSQEEGLSKTERQRILSQVIINKIMTPIKVIKHIELQIKLKEHNDNYDLACKKWREDISFIKNEFM